LDDLLCWKAHTDGEFKAAVFPGDHFYIRSDTTFLINAISSDLAGLL